MEPRYYHHFIGGNFRLDEMQAAILAVKLPFLDGWSAARRGVADFYREEFKRLGLTSQLSLPAEPYRDRGLTNHHIYHQYAIRTPQRDALREHLTRKEIGTAIYYPLGLHEQKCFAYLGYRAGDFPETERAARETLALPMYPELSREAQRYVAESIADFFAKERRFETADLKNGGCKPPLLEAAKPPECGTRLRHRPRAKDLRPRAPEPISTLAPTGRYRSGQTGRTVNPLAYAFTGSNPVLPISPSQPSSLCPPAFRARSGKNSCTHDVSRNNHRRDLEREGEIAFHIDDRKDRERDVKQRHEKPGRRGDPQPPRRRRLERAQSEKRNGKHDEIRQRVKNSAGVEEKLKRFLLSHSDETERAERHRDYSHEEDRVHRRLETRVQFREPARHEVIPSLPPSAVSLGQ